jgi:RNA polymerase sigma factor (sigma-70 family)
MEVSEKQEFVQGALRGDPVAFAALVVPARGLVLSIVSRLVGPDDAEDVLQEALLRAYLGLSRLRDPERFESWLCGVAVNVAKMRIRGRVTERRALAAIASSGSSEATSEQWLLDEVRDALEVLPAGQRDVVLMHYIDDLSCDQIAQVVGSTSGAVRVQLHRARTRLRRELAPLAPLPFTPPTKERSMVDVNVEDVVVRVAAEDPSRVLQELGVVVLLKEARGGRSLLIIVGFPEGVALAIQHADGSFQRPSTPDLIVDLLRATGGHVEHVAITALRESTFYAQIAINGENVDARPSDAINLAVRLGAPIVVDEVVLNTAGFDRVTLDHKLENIAAQIGFAIPPGEWKSLSLELVRGALPQGGQLRPAGPTS